jgi:hypothetical protein
MNTTNYSIRNESELCRVVLRMLVCESVRGNNEVVESFLFEHVDQETAAIDNMIGELVDIEYVRSTVVQIGERFAPALVLTDKGYGAWQEISQRAA